MSHRTIFKLISADGVSEVIIDGNCEVCNEAIITNYEILSADLQELSHCECEANK